MPLWNRSAPKKEFRQDQESFDEEQSVYQSGPIGGGQFNGGHQDDSVGGGQIGVGHQSPVGTGTHGGRPQAGFQRGFGGQHNGGPQGNPMFGGVPLGGGQFGGAHNTVPVFYGTLGDGPQAGFQRGNNGFEVAATCMGETTITIVDSEMVKDNNSNTIIVKDLVKAKVVDSGKEDMYIIMIMIMGIIMIMIMTIIMVTVTNTMAIDYE
uniref:Uncharacterized protein n=1 Tax=Anopheles minimus TaxID=112268 RepID=A0A182WI15_9DIPT